MTIRTFLAALSAAALTLPASGALAAEVEITAQGPVIELSVFESVTADPDLVTIGAGVTSEAPTAVEAMRQNAAEMRRVIDRLIALGVAEEDIQTTGINLNARYDYDRTRERQVFRGYQVSNRVSVKLREIEETGAVLDALVVAGATNLSGPSFSIEDDEAAKDLARERAIDRAQARAEAYARMLGYSGVKVLSISEAIQGRGPSPQMAMRAMDVAEQSMTAPVQPGQVSTGVSIAIKYEMIGGGAR
ncbi:SIMPL domain-containing protein [Qipengyuania nanhaisediminis]|uniref:SIMPL domain-containing protein n=1 Tax=Qipengyuania nanhaisediminis TaxID=604088 RepID=UPI0038B2C6B1